VTQSLGKEKVTKKTPLEGKALHPLIKRALSRGKEDVINSYEFGFNQFGESQTVDYHNQLEERFKFLADNPYVAPLATVFWSTPTGHFSKGVLILNG
jgi:hypothetical protein